LKRLQRFNRIKGSIMVPAGQTIYLASMRPQTDNLATTVEQPVTVDNSETFNWTASPDSEEPRKDTLEIPATTVVSSVSEIVTVEENAQVPVLLEEPEETAPTQTPVGTEVAVEVAEEKNEPISEPLPTIKKTEHVVQAKETFYSIAKMYNIGVMELVQWNNLDLQQGLKIGQVLKLSDSQPITRVSAPISSKEVVHEVKSSDTLYSIARQYGVTIKELMDWNAKKDFSLAVGEKLKIQQHQ
jgi:membrane-bound lytic murein transglycosylase D